MRKRLFFFYLLFVISYLLLAIRLFNLQVVQGKRNLELSEGNRIKIERVEALRGIIYDRNGEALVYNIQTNTPGELSSNTPGVFVASLTRDYLYGEILAHLIGYVDVDYKGVSGLEKEYDELLAGQDGGEIIEVAVDSSKLRQLDYYEPAPGENLYLNIDLELQKVAYQALGDQKGAVVISQPYTGEILALVSKPSFNPNVFSHAVTPPRSAFAHLAGVTTAESLLDNPGQPLFNRATHGVYPPGSIFKIVTAAAGLESGQINAETLIEDTGEIKVNTYRYGNWYFDRFGKTEGMVNIIKAIKRSNDIFFYRVGERVGPKKIIEWAKAFGLGQKIGFLPDLEAERWFLGNTYHLSIGQGKLGITTLQANLMTNVIANGGKLCEAKWIWNSPDPEKTIRDRNLQTIPDRKSSGSSFNCQEIGLSQKTIEIIKEGMKEACSEGGTSLRFLDFDFKVACKTGTAEFGSPTDETHAWFTIFVPADDPEISITVLVEAGGGGSEIAAPIAKGILKSYLSLK